MHLPSGDNIAALFLISLTKRMPKHKQISEMFHENLFGKFSFYCY